MLLPEPVGVTLPRDLLPDLASFAARHLGLAFPPDRYERLVRGVCAAAAECGIASAPDYAARLLAGDALRQQIAALAAHLTIGETYFFREPAAFDALRYRILPRLAAAKSSAAADERRIRIWSAGCATGEEAYSVAILLELCAASLAGCAVSLLATDLNDRSLERARRGLYRDWSFRGVSEVVRSRFFRQLPDGAYEIAEALRRRITFAPVNLAEPGAPASDMDVILCRNVLLYFEPAQAEKAGARLTKALRPGGFLVIGAAEAALPCFVDNELLDALEPTLFRRREAAAARSPSPPFVARARSARAPRLSTPPRRHAAVVPAPSSSDFRRAVEECLRAGRSDEALALALQWAGIAPTELRPKLLLARILADRGALSDAVAWSESAIATVRTDPEALYIHANILIEMGRQDEATKSLQRALYLAPDFVLAHYALGFLEMRHGKRVRARKHFENAAALLAVRPAQEVLTGPDGLTVGELREVVRTLQESTVSRAAS